MFTRIPYVAAAFVAILLTILLVFNHKQSVAIEKKAENLEVNSVELDRAYSIFYKTEKAIKFNQEDLLCMARNIFFEAATESIVGKYAVAQVTINRVEHSKFPTTVCKVVYAPYQFSWTLDKKLMNSKPKGARWDESVHVAFQVLYGNVRLSLVDDALFYHATYVNPRWAKHKHFIARIETHIFYKYREVQRC